MDNRSHLFDTAAQLREFIDIWQILREPDINPNHPPLELDQLQRILHQVGVQDAIQRPPTSFLPSKVWKARVTPKCKSFAWLVRHGRILTVEYLTIGDWLLDPICRLCLGLLRQFRIFVGTVLSPRRSRTWLVLPKGFPLTQLYQSVVDDFLATNSDTKASERSGNLIYSL